MHAKPSRTFSESSRQPPKAAIRWFLGHVGRARMVARESSTEVLNDFDFGRRCLVSDAGRERDKMSIVPLFSILYLIPFNPPSPPFTACLSPSAVYGLLPPTWEWSNPFR
jgi:hypothetical protein